MSPIIIFILGLEGTGHHLVASYLRKAGLHTMPFTPNLVQERNINFRSQYMKFVQSRPYVIHTVDSYPEGRPSHVEKHPAIHTIEKLSVDLRLLRLKRNPVDAICSAYRRFGGDVVHLATVARDSIAVLNTYNANDTLIFERAASNSTYVIEILKKLTVGLPANFNFTMPTFSPTKYTCPHRNWLKRFWFY